MPKISVIIPVYNVEEYLRECLDSVVNQTLKDIEIICVNDGSTDNSLAILEEYAAKDERLRVFTQENQGQSVARNLGIEKARGEYIGFVDSDDWIDLDFYEKLYRTAEKAQADIACANIYKPDEKRYYIKYNKVKVVSKTLKKYDVADIPRWNYIWNKIYKRSSLNKISHKFKPNVCYEDMIWTPKIVYFLNRMVSVPGVTYYYRYNQNSTVWNFSEEHCNDFVSAQIETYDFIKKHKIFCKTQNFKHISEKYYKFCGVTILKQKNYIFCKKYYLFSRIPCFEIWKFNCEKNIELKITKGV